MSSIGENLEFCDSSGSDIMEEEIGRSEQQVCAELNIQNEEHTTPSQKVAGKRTREDSEEIIEEDEGFITSKSYRDVVVNNSFDGLNVNDEKLYMEKSEDEGNDTDCTPIQRKKKEKMKKRKNQNNQRFEEYASEVEHESETCAHKTYQRSHENTIFKKLVSKIKYICISNNCRR
ncbi:hypothetical protein HF086_011477 [Spodoptera exigua]|uniref:Uncharacterized protein n=1 Tax=Spodoptera exigua TaxID=7107 RepID=A0A922M4V7_SPOEX|nr:hypothetical protein HF086_011477 [Spodoptera exigua]